MSWLQFFLILVCNYDILGPKDQTQSNGKPRVSRPFIPFDMLDIPPRGLLGKLQQGGLFFPDHLHFFQGPLSLNLQD